MKYITVLDFEDGKVYQYEISACDDCNYWNPDYESIEEYLTGKGHSINSCEWMCHKTNTIHYR